MNNYREFQRHDREIDSDLESKALQRLYAFTAGCGKHVKRFITYPCNFAFNLKSFFDWWTHSVEARVAFNDVGNPEEDIYCHLNAHIFEKEVVQYFSTLYGFEHDTAWGYVTSGGTQGNEQGLFMGRESLKQYGIPILYVSEAAHYSIQSLGKILDIETRVVLETPAGEMDYKNLEEQLEPTRPALFSICFGGTFKGGIDNIELIDQVVKKKGIRHVYYHCDAALFGGFLPFCTDPSVPKISFKDMPYDSIAVSGHKFFGSPIPLGIFLTRKQHLDKLTDTYIDYIDSKNATITCSRSSLNTMLFWWMITTVTKETYREETKLILENAQFLHNELIKMGYESYLNPFSNTVYFKVPPLDVKTAWNLATSKCRYKGTLAHIVVMQHVSKEILTRFLNELSANG